MSMRDRTETPQRWNTVELEREGNGAFRREEGGVTGDNEQVLVGKKKLWQTCFLILLLIIRAG